MSNVNVGDRVRVVSSPTPALPVGTVGTVHAVVKAIPGAIFFKAEGIDRPLGVLGRGWALLDTDVEPVAA